MQKKLNKNLIILITLLSIAMVGFVVLAALVLAKHNFQIDKFNNFVAKNRMKGWVSFFKIFTHIGSFYTLALSAVVLACLLFFVFKKKRFALFSAVCFGSVCIANYILKIIVKRARPSHFMIIAETGYSFPSGHAMMTFAFFALVICFAVKFIKNKPLKISLISICSFLIVLVSFTRIYLGVHYLTDVLAGWLVTFAIVVLFMILYNLNIFSKLTDEKYLKLNNKEKKQ